MMTTAARKPDPSIIKGRAEMRASNAAETRARRGLVNEAKTTLRAFQDSEDVAPAVPTPERLTMAGDHWNVEEAISVEEVIGHDGRPKTEEIVRKRIRLEDSPLGRLASRGLLAPAQANAGDKKFLNMALRRAGEQYAEHWQNGTPTLGAMDPSKPFISDSRVPAYFQNEWQLGEWQIWLQSSLAIHFREHRAVVEAVVLHDQEPATIARVMTGRADKQTGVAIVLDRLIFGLGDLAMHFGMLDKKDLAR